MFHLFRHSNRICNSVISPRNLFGHRALCTEKKPANPGNASSSAADADVNQVPELDVLGTARKGEASKFQRYIFQLVFIIIDIYFLSKHSPSRTKE